MFASLAKADDDAELLWLKVSPGSDHCLLLADCTRTGEHVVQQVPVYHPCII